MGSGFGYAYRHELWMDDEIMVRYVPPERRSRSKVFFFEFRTNFVLASATTGCRYGRGSERFHCSSCSKDTSLLTETNVRLCGEYRMTRHEAQSLCLSAMDFAQKMESDHPHLDVIPVVVGIEVCTVQQPGESIVAFLDRAIPPHRLLPMSLVETRYLLEMPNSGVESVVQGLGVMDVFGEGESKMCGENSSLIESKLGDAAFKGIAGKKECHEKKQMEDATNVRAYDEIDKLRNQVSVLDKSCKVQEEELRTQVSNYKSSFERAVLERDVVQKRLEEEKRKSLRKKKKREEMRSYIGELETKLAKTKADDYAKSANESREVIRSLKNQLADARMEVSSVKSELEWARDDLVDCLERGLEVSAGNEPPQGLLDVVIENGLMIFLAFFLFAAIFLGFLGCSGLGWVGLVLLFIIPHFYLM